MRCVGDCPVCLSMVLHQALHGSNACLCHLDEHGEGCATCFGSKDYWSQECWCNGVEKSLMCPVEKWAANDDVFDHLEWGLPALAAMWVGGAWAMPGIVFTCKSVFSQHVYGGTEDWAGKCLNPSHEFWWFTQWWAV
jgi:hypothetical protein